MTQVMPRCCGVVRCGQQPCCLSAQQQSVGKTTRTVDGIFMTRQCLIDVQLPAMVNLTKLSLWRASLLQCLIAVIVLITPLSVLPPVASLVMGDCRLYAFCNDAAMCLDRQSMEWKNIKAPQETKVRRNTAGYLDGSVYVLGGEDTGRVNCLDVATGNWTPSPALNLHRSGPAVTKHEGCLYVLGGTNRGYESSCERFDPREGQWRAVASMHSGRFGPAVASIGDKIYVCSGDTKAGGNETEVYDMRANTWDNTALASLPGDAGGVGIASCVIDDVWYLAGGYFGAEGYGEQQSVPQSWRMNVQSGEWESIPAMQTPRSWCGGASLCGEFFICGGSTGVGLDIGRIHDSCEVLCPTDDKPGWSDGPTLTTAEWGVTVASSCSCCSLPPK
eukprot:m.55522 g.55522  ORF g.55522 m.55522 type:complete len:389 (+) comp12536_c0_seq1:824-1990(+)